MVNWNSTATLATFNAAIDKVDLVMLGMYSWECFSTSGLLEWQLLTRRKKFKWPMLVYLTSKWSIFWFILGINIAFQNKHQIDCQSLSIFINLNARIGMWTASGLLALRTIALWERDKRVIVPLAIASLGQIALFIHNIFIVREEWSPADRACIVVGVTNGPTKAQFIYTMIFDFVVLVLALYALVRLPGRSTLWRLLITDGIVYFIIAFACYLAATIMAFLDLNPISIFIVSDPATILATTAANRSFLRIGAWAQTTEQPIAAPPTSSPLHTVNRNRYSNGQPPFSPGVRFSNARPDGVCVQMETITTVYSPPPTHGFEQRGCDDRDDSCSDLEAQPEKIPQYPSQEDSRDITENSYMGPRAV